MSHSLHDPYDWLTTNSNLPEGYPEEFQVVTINNILFESLHTIDVAYYDRIPMQEVYVESDKKTYKSNSIGHTGPEAGQVDTLIIGCSLTSGIGLHFEQTWGHKVGQEIGGSYTSLGFVGGSISKIVRNAVEYIYKYGKPKRILFLSPDAMRVDAYLGTLPTRHKYHLTDGNHISRSVQKINMVYAPNREIEKFHKRILDISYAYAISGAALHSFIRFCEFLGIQFYWTSWATPYNYGSDAYKNYIPLDFDNDSLKTLTCHQELSHEDEFDIATDNDHYGSHYHAHVAEAFIARLKEDNAL